MPLLWMADGRGEQADRSRVARPEQPVEQPIGTRGREQRADVASLAARVLDALPQHSRHGAPSPWRLSSEIASESSHEGGWR